MTMLIAYPRTDHQGAFDVYVQPAHGDAILVRADVTDEGVDWLADQMALVDDGDRQQLEAVALDVRRRCPNRYSWTWVQMQAQKLDSQALRRANGTFRSQGAW